MRLSEEQLNERLPQLAGWEREDGKWMRKRYRFATFMDGIEFVCRVAAIAEQMNHHPMIAIDYKLVTLRLTTWSEGGLTELDLSAAAVYDEVFSTN